MLVKCACKTRQHMQLTALATCIHAVIGLVPCRVPPLLPQAEYEAKRQAGAAPAMFIATPYDLHTSRW